MLTLVDILHSLVVLLVVLVIFNASGNYCHIVFKALHGANGRLWSCGNPVIYKQNTVDGGNLLQTMRGTAFQNFDTMVEVFAQDFGNTHHSWHTIGIEYIHIHIELRFKLGIFEKLPIKHKCITAQPLIEAIDIERYLDGVELVVVGGESDTNARPLDYAWVLDIREQCIRKNVSFEFRQCGTHFIKDGKEYKLQTKDLCSQARKAGIDFKAYR